MCNLIIKLTKGFLEQPYAFPDIEITLSQYLPHGTVLPEYLEKLLKVLKPLLNEKQYRFNFTIDKCDGLK